MGDALRSASSRVVVATLVLAGTVFLPWTRSGQVSRSGWSVVGSARRLSVIDSAAGEVALFVFFAVPMLAFAAVALHAVEKYLAVTVAATASIVATVVVAYAIGASPLGLRWGLWLNVGVAAVDVVLVARLASIIRLASVVRSR